MEITQTTFKLKTKQNDNRMNGTVDQSFMINCQTPVHLHLPRVDNLTELDLNLINQTVNETGVAWTSESEEENNNIKPEVLPPKRKRVKLFKYEIPAKKKKKVTEKDVTKQKTKEIPVASNTPPTIKTPKMKVVVKEVKEKSAKKARSKKKTEKTVQAETEPTFKGRITRSRAKILKS